ncbi:MAG: DUF554 domain-containing protein [Firmicutes bacterium]|nr:DUF554 domain-containing protein [Alicyclobacillaceae bacterium]MCL6496129.1 DUF554 domain-containing protein [Bacillota bacterium]
MFEGALVNGLGILAGGLFGLIGGRRLSDRFRIQAQRLLGLAVGWIGLGMANGPTSPALLMAALLVGGWIGDALQLEERLARWQDAALGRFGSWIHPLIQAAMIFNVGALAVLGSVQAGTTGTASILEAKAVLDGITAALLAAATGPGVLGAAVVTTAYEGALTALAAPLQRLLTAPTVHALNGEGGLIILAIAANLVTSRPWFRVANLLPAIVVAPLLAGFTARTPIRF